MTAGGAEKMALYFRPLDFRGSAEIAPVCSTFESIEQPEHHEAIRVIARPLFVQAHPLNSSPIVSR